jgi:superoxide reductase
MTEVLHPGAGTLVCCGKDMIHMTDEVKPEISGEKHIPIVEIEGTKVTVKVGSIAHPMTPEHYIERIEVITENRTYKKFLNPDPARPDEPIAIFDIDAKIIAVREYCNLHGLRKAEI